MTKDFRVFFLQIDQQPRRITAALDEAEAAAAFDVEPDTFAMFGGETRDPFERSAAACYPGFALTSTGRNQWEILRELQPGDEPLPAETIRVEAPPTSANRRRLRPSELNR